MIASPPGSKNAVLRSKSLRRRSVVINEVPEGTSRSHEPISAGRRRRSASQNESRFAARLSTGRISTHSLSTEYSPARRINERRSSRSASAADRFIETCGIHAHRPPLWVAGPKAGTWWSRRPEPRSTSDSVGDGSFAAAGAEASRLRIDGVAGSGVGSRCRRTRSICRSSAAFPD